MGGNRSTQRCDVAIVGGGHNALVAAAYLARAGLAVTVLERLDHTGGAAVSSRPWPHLDARLSRYSYLVSLLPDLLVNELGLDLELRSRPTASYTPYVRADGTSDGLLVETEPGPATRASFRRLTGSDDAFASWTAFYDDVAALAHVVAATLTEPLPREADLRRRVDPTTWTDVVERPIGDVVRRRFDHDLLRGVVATDALIGIGASVDDPTLVQNRCFLYHVVGRGTGEWRVPVGGMGAVTDALRRAAEDAGATIRTGHTVQRLDPDDDGVDVDVTSAGGLISWRADRVLVGAAPAVLADLLGEAVQPGAEPRGAQLKVNLLLSRLPALRSGADPRVAFAGTFHVEESLTELETAHRRAPGSIDRPTPGELYCHTLTDPSILGPELAAAGAHTLTWFGLHHPYDAQPDDAQPDDVAGEAAVRDVVAALDRHLAEPIGPLVLGVEHKTPRDVERALAMPGGHIFHGDLDWPWLPDDLTTPTPAEQWGVATSHPRILLCGSGSRRGGAVSGLGGHSAARATLLS